MGTPRGVEHRDLEQRFRGIEQRCAELANQVLAQRRLEVTSGDFVVSGGGGVVVADGGVIRSEHPNGARSFYVGPFDSTEGAAYAFLVEDPQGYGLIRAYQTAGGQDQVWLGHETSRPKVTTYGDNVVVDASLGVTVKSGTSGVLIDGYGGVAVQTHGQQLQLGLDASGTYIGHTTTSSAANARLESNGFLTRSTSSLRYKRDVEDAEVDPDAVLAMRARTWRDRAEVAEDPETTSRYVGFIAEELDALGLRQFVEYDDRGRPDAISYDRLTVGLLAVAKRQQEQLAALASRVEALENQLSA